LIAAAKSTGGMGLCRASVTPDTAPRIAAKFYKAVVQDVLLYGSEMWNLTNLALVRLEGVLCTCGIQDGTKASRKEGCQWSLGLSKVSGCFGRMRHGYHCRIHSVLLADDRNVYGNETNLYSLCGGQMAMGVNAASMVVGATNVLGCY
jgi:hypothetical protein